MPSLGRDPAPTGGAIAAGRAGIEGVLAKSYADAGPVVDDAVLVGSELLTNAVRVGAPTLGLRLDLHADAVEVAVHDTVAGQPEPAAPTPTSTAGRGLVVVAAVADAWGVRPAGAATGVTGPVGAVGKEVWVRLAVPGGAAPRFNCERSPL